MEIDRKELKLQARERMALTDPKFWVVALTYIAMTTGVSWVISLIPLPSGASPVPEIDTIQLFLRLLLNLYTTVVQFGLGLWALWTYRQLDPGVNSLMQGFSVAGRVILMQLNVYVRVLGWYFLTALGLSIPVFVLLLSGAGGALGMVIILCYSIALLTALIILQLRYAMAPYLLADRPDDGPTLPVYRSVSLMQGWKMELFKLEFSFIGYDAVNIALSTAVMIFFLFRAGLLSAASLTDPTWRIQCLEIVNSVPVVILSTLVTVPIDLWLLPYRATARAGFYDARILAASQQGQLPPL